MPINKSYIEDITLLDDNHVFIAGFIPFQTPIALVEFTVRHFSYTS